MRARNAVLLLALFAGTGLHAQQAADPRVGLATGWKDAGVAARGMELLAHVDRPAGFFDAGQLGNILLANSDLAFRGTTLFLGSFHGFQVFDIADPKNPKLRTAFICPGGQGDMSVHGNLLFMSVEMPNGRVDCGTNGPTAAVSTERFRGVRIFDITNLEQPKQIAAVQTCRGSHTHTLVTSPKDRDNLYIYVSGTSMVRPAAELAGCSGGNPEQDPNTSLFRIEVIQVPLARPQDARVVAAPRIFADRETGAAGGLWKGGSHGQGTQQTARTDQCHDITVYPELGLAAGACSGNGILLDISQPANPVRIHEVIDPNFAYWHSATFNNAGTSVIFTDEWGGGMAARCRESDRPEWGANALFALKDRKLQHAGYYKLPAAQSGAENCVAHNGSLVPVPGRDIKVQAWYQGGISVFDFTDPAKPFEIAYFDRGPMTNGLALGGFWSAYWYNGHIYGSEIGRGLDVLRLTPGEHLTQNEIDAASLVRFDTFNPQHQERITWPASYAVARAYIDQLRRGALASTALDRVATGIEQSERLPAAERRTRLRQLAADVTELEENLAATPADRRRITLLAEQLRAIAAAAR